MNAFLELHCMDGIDAYRSNRPRSAQPQTSNYFCGVAMKPHPIRSRILRAAAALVVMAYTLSGGPPARAAQTPRPGLALTVKPLRGAAGVVTQLDVTEVLSAGPLQDGAPLQLALPLLLNGSHLAERVNDLLVSDAAGAVPL